MSRAHLISREPDAVPCWCGAVHWAGCADCGRPYGDAYGFPDLVVPHEVWNRHLSPTGNEGGLLCPSCMCQRAHAAGLRGVSAVFRSGPFTDEPL